MTDADVLESIAAIRAVCDQIARSIATHSASPNHGDHGTTDCTEGLSRMATGFAFITARASHAAMDMTADIAEAVRDLLQHGPDNPEDR